MSIVQNQNGPTTTQATSEEASEYSNDNMLQTANIFMSKTASIAYLELQGVNGRKFHFAENTMKQILLPDYATHSQNNSAVTDLLKRIHLQKIFIQSGTHNGFPFPLGIRINNIKGNEFTMSGECWNYIIPQKCTISSPVCIFESKGDESLMATWEQDFAKWNSENLETLCAMPVPDSDIVMVHLDHPVVGLLDKKFAEFNCLAPTDQPSPTPNWRQIPLQAFQRACQWLRNNILSKSTKTFDLSSFTLYISKIDNSKFIDLAAGCFTDMTITGRESVGDMNTKKADYANILVQMPFNVDIKLCLQYRLSMTQDVTS